MKLWGDIVRSAPSLMRRLKFSNAIHGLFD